ncbi:coniferyl aldehyde dehydrogenase [Ferrimonas lipolytica]|uniref:Aldehyde dehydrogenase n=1 Tax=Ferrimonas lipolytica TaxID=2724191 RepID=A0A6H1U9C6_9GAMM|nr:coniferyl aldehyde dehydrogenase [Ferrimonas lipolytica]QIZ75647.1 coniferyl aldehyde dehydrogenase [Ferrimonas lipolytica]
MNLAHANAQPQDAIESMQQLLEKQRAYYRANPAPTAAKRSEDLATLAELIKTWQDRIVNAINTDFGQRAKYDTLFTDIVPSLNLIHYSRKNLKKWMKPSRRSPGLMLAPSKVEVRYQPLGVIGIMVPWNFPIYLAMGPLITAIAAGNCAMIKMSEFTPATNAVLRQMLAEKFTEEQIAVVEGEAEASAAFSSLPFDHILFTGSTAVGKHVMRAAAANLTPVTLELGGKSPTIIAPDFDIKEAVARLIYGKCLNAGQICTAPDYVLLPRDKLNEFIDAYRAHFNKCFPAGLASKDFTSVINARQYQRLSDTLQDAVDRGAKVHAVVEHPRDDANHRMATHLLTDVDDQMTVMQQEIFGPLLPLVPYDSIDDAINYVNDRPRPLALYLMSFNDDLQQRILNETHAGGVSLNDSVVHVAADDAPFGGVGPSGMGHYHGHEGFKTFSHAKTVLHRGKINYTKLMQPPYGNVIQRLMVKMFT